MKYYGFYEKATPIYIGVTICNLIMTILNVALMFEYLKR